MTFAVLACVGLAALLTLGDSGGGGRGFGILLCGSYVNPQTGSLTEVWADLSVDREVFCGTRIGYIANVRIQDKPSEEAAPTGIGTRTNALANVRGRFESLCEQLGCPGTAELFDEALASPSGRASRIDWWRYPLAVLHGSSPYIFACSIVGLTVCVWRDGRAWRRRDRQTRGLCAKCGYKLEGLPTFVCPECGTARGA